MGDVVELEIVKRERRVDELCKAVARDFCGVEVIDGTVVAHLGELNFYWSADEADDLSALLSKAAAEVREQ